MSAELKSLQCHTNTCPPGLKSACCTDLAYTASVRHCAVLRSKMLQDQAGARITQCHAAVQRHRPPGTPQHMPPGMPQHAVQSKGPSLTDLPEYRHLSFCNRVCQLIGLMLPASQPVTLSGPKTDLMGSTVQMQTSCSGCAHGQRSDSRDVISHLEQLRIDAVLWTYPLEQVRDDAGLGPYSLEQVRDEAGHGLWQCSGRSLKQSCQSGQVVLIRRHSGLRQMPLSAALSDKVSCVLLRQLRLHLAAGLQVQRRFKSVAVRPCQESSGQQLCKTFRP